MNRKEFITGLASLGILASVPNSVQALVKQKNKTPFGVQLWSLKEDMLVNANGVLKVLAKAGYQQIESFEGSQGMFWNKSPKGFATFLKSLNLNCISSHVNIKENFEQKAAQAAEAGLQYLICPWIGPQKSLDDFKKTAETFNRCGEICKQNGLKFAYHNHEYSFVKLENEYPQDILMKNTDFELVHYEMDVYWVVVAGQNPVEWLKKYPNRFSLCHIKDREKKVPPDEKFASCTLGNGSIDYAKIIPEFKQLNMQYFIVEQEKFAEGTPLYCIEQDAKVIRTWLALS